MKKKRRKPRFFCDGCGAEVSAAAKSCPSCGKFFAAMRCPRCGFCGEHEEFSDGCPACGYAAPSRPLPKSADETARDNADNGRQWLYAVGVAALVLLLAVLLAHILR
ncbi:MAG: hypothetical protein LBH50_05060 [Spirochaetaceae bacterium]|nr:hypothetical protein [Spirochaetaceae bacterium]